MYPEKGDRLLVDPGRQMFQDTFGGQKFVQTGYTFVSSSGLDVTIAAGTAFAAGTRIGRDVTTVVAATNSATTYIFVYYKDDLDDNVVYFEINTTGTPPSGYTATSQKIMEVVASGGVITNDTDTRTLSPFAGPLRLGPLTGTFDLLSGDVAGRSRIGLSTSEDRVLFDGKTGGSTAAAVDVFRNTDTSGARQFRVFQGDGTATLVAQIDQAGRLALPITGVNAGLLIGGDANIYRSAADILHTDDIFESAVYFHGRSGGGAGAALRVGNDAELHDINITDAMGLRGVSDPANAILIFGSANDTRIFRGAANRLDLGSGDSLQLSGGGNILMGTGDTVDGVDVSNMALKDIWLPPEMGDSSTGGPSLVNISGTSPDWQAWVFSATSNNAVEWKFIVPRDWDGISGFTVKIYWGRSGTGTGTDVVWMIRYVAVAAGENIDTPGFTTLSTTTRAVPAVDVLEVFDTGTIGAGSLAVGDIVDLSVFRDGDAVPDDFSLTAWVVGVLIEYTAG